MHARLRHKKRKVIALSSFAFAIAPQIFSACCYSLSEYSKRLITRMMSLYLRIYVADAFSIQIWSHLKQYEIMLNIKSKS